MREINISEQSGTFQRSLAQAYVTPAQEGKDTRNSVEENSESSTEDFFQEQERKRDERAIIERQILARKRAELSMMTYEELAEIAGKETVSPPPIRALLYTELEKEATTEVQRGSRVSIYV